MENIYCDLDLVISELYDFADIRSKKDGLCEIDDVDVSFLRGKGFGDIFEYLMSIEENNRNFEIYLRKSKQLFVKFSDLNILISYVKKDNRTTVFKLRKLNL